MSYRLARPLLALVLLLVSVFAANAQDIPVHVFWQEGCPHCARAKAALTDIATKAPDVTLDLIELGPDETNNQLFGDTLTHFRVVQPAVPFVVIGGDFEIGFASGGITETRFRDMIAFCRAAPCADPVADLRTARTPAPTEAPQQAAAPDPEAETAPPAPTRRITLPLLGEMQLTELSLPLLTVVLAGVDGFNPCAMWVLALLIGLLLGVQDTRRMWVLGGVFLLATGAMYFAVMAAWLNVVLWLGAVGWLRLAIGALAVVAGGYYLREYWTNPEGLCRVTPTGRRGTIRDAFQRMIEQPNLALAALGVAALAVAVNLVELACSAGLPAIYTQTLAMHDLPQPGYYGYLLLYLSIFLLDDTVLFVVAMLTLRAVAATGRYSRLSHLVGGIVLLVLGAVMILRPDLLG